jgi:FMN phosphatase YigB (HAD superfamily)
MLPKMICFDMDGTLADLYNVPNWLEQLRAFDPTPYREAECMWDEEELAYILNTLIDNGVEVRIITWLSKESTPEYDEAVREAKREWLEALGIPYTHFHGVKYGATKADSIRRYLEEDETAWLFDDNAKVRQGWRMGEAFDPTAIDILDLLYALLD